MDISVDPWPEIQRNHGYSPEFVKQALEARRRRQSEQLREQERIRAIKRMKRHGAPEWVADTIFATAAAYNVSAADIMFGVRTYDVVDARHAAIYEVKATKPVLSSTVLAKWFGIDHTTVLFGLAAYAHKTGAPSMTKYKMRPRYGYRAADYADRSAA
jgi:chromosomal replication initiation ATPase DnaA